jgi:hypothetical protein
VLAETCVLVNASELAASNYEQLLPYAERNVVATAASVCLGSVSRYLGLLAELAERFDDAEHHLHAAHGANRRMGARLWLAHVECDLARVRAKRAGPGDVRQADEAIAGCLRTADQWGLDALRDRAQAVRGMWA